jgi:hypothetical protein
MKAEKQNNIKEGIKEKNGRQKETFFFFTQISIYLKFYRSILFSIQQNRWIKENYLFRMRKLKDQGKID